MVICERVSVNILKISIFTNLIFSEFHICSTGDISSDFGTRGGDSGTLVFLEENGRYLFIRYFNLYLVVFDFHF